MGCDIRYHVSTDITCQPHNLNKTLFVLILSSLLLEQSGHAFHLCGRDIFVSNFGKVFYFISHWNEKTEKSKTFIITIFVSPVLHCLFMEQCIHFMLGYICLSLQYFLHIVISILSILCMFIWVYFVFPFCLFSVNKSMDMLILILDLDEPWYN